MVWVVVTLVAVLIFVVAYFSVKAHKQLLAEGKIISRSPDFMESAEEFILSQIEPAQITEAVRALDYSDLGVGMRGSGAQQVFQFTGQTWGAQLRRLADEDGRAVYRFQFTNWKTHNGMAQDALRMNKLATALEKLFLGLDPKAQVRTVPLEYHTKHSFF